MNNSPENIEFVRVTSTFYDSNGKSVTAVSGYTYIPLLRPGEKSGFVLMVSNTNQINRIASYSLSLQYDTTTNTKPALLELTENGASTDIFGLLHITGEIRNMGNMVSDFPRVVGIFYDGNNTIVTVRAEFTLSPTIEPGASTPFELIMSSNVDRIQSYELNVQSDQYSMYNPDLEQFAATLQERQAMTELTGVDTISILNSTYGNLDDGGSVMRVGQEVMVKVLFANNSVNDQHFTAIMEIRNPEGVTIQLESQEGVLPYMIAEGIATSWVPDMPGDYTVRMFALKSLDEPEILSPVGSVSIRVV